MLEGRPRAHDPSAPEAELGLVLIAERAVWEVKQRTLALEESSRELSRLLRDLAQPTAGAAQAQAPVTASSSTIRRDLLAWQCQEELLVLLASDEVPGPEEVERDRTRLATAVQRGVDVRVLLAGGWTEPALVARLVGESSGIAVRTVETPPVSMVISDRRVALLAEIGAGAEDGATSLEQQAAVTALCSLFDAYWQGAASLDVPAAGDAVRPVAPSQSEHARLAALLADGSTDEAVARALGMSVRKLVRLVSVMREDLGAQTRFQLGVRAAREGLV